MNELSYHYSLITIQYTTGKQCVIGLYNDNINPFIIIVKPFYYNRIFDINGFVGYYVIGGEVRKESHPSQ